MKLHQTLLAALVSILCITPVFSKGIVEVLEKAEKGDATAQKNLGLSYWKGEGVPEDKAEALKWFRKAADQGNVTAQYNLGVVYSKGEGVPEDKAEALKLLRKAADQGHAQAQAILGIAYSDGEGVPENYIQAYMWYNLASAQGFEGAKTNKVKLTQKMTKEQIAEAQKLSTQWFERKAKEKKK